MYIPDEEATLIEGQTDEETLQKLQELIDEEETPAQQQQ